MINNNVVIIKGGRGIEEGVVCVTDINITQVFHDKRATSLLVQRRRGGGGGGEGGEGKEEERGGGGGGGEEEKLRRGREEKKEVDDNIWRWYQTCGTAICNL